MRFKVDQAEWIPAPIRTALSSSRLNAPINSRGEIVITSAMQRTQEANSRDCIKKLKNLLKNAELVALGQPTKNEEKYEKIRRNKAKNKRRAAKKEQEMELLYLKMKLEQPQQHQEQSVGEVENVGPLRIPGASVFPAQDCPISFLLGHESSFQVISNHIQQAKQRVWIMVSFITKGISLLGTPFFELLQKTADRGVDVRVIFWDNFFSGKGSGTASNVFFLDPHNIHKIQTEMPSVKVSFDPSPSQTHCHHAKTFLIDDIAYIGGIILSAHQQYTVVDSAGRAISLYHDSYSAVQGAIATDLATLFALRWNGVKESNNKRFFPSRDEIKREQLEVVVEGSGKVCKFSSTAEVKLLYTVMENMYPKLSFVPPHLSTPIDLSNGGESIAEWYISHLKAAKQGIWMESTHIADPTILGYLLNALNNGVPVFYLHVTESMRVVQQERDRYLAYLKGTEGASRYTKAFILHRKLAEHPLCCFAFMATNVHSLQETMKYLPSSAPTDHLIRKDGKMFILGLHSKVTIIDGLHYTNGSANQVDISLWKSPENGHTEVNVGVTGQEATQEVLRNNLQVLLESHYTEDLLKKPFREVITYCQDLAKQNRQRWMRKEPIHGKIVQMDLLSFHKEKETRTIFQGWEE
uniref:Phospholipase D-like domain-containing protein n=1 Tax=Arcella intermedia TaxID=1963864 RepID=A0A6B2KZ84_9EUKA